MVQRMNSSLFSVPEEMQVLIYNRMSARSLCRLRRSHKIIDELVEERRSNIMTRSPLSFVIDMVSFEIKSFEFYVINADINTNFTWCDWYDGLYRKGRRKITDIYKSISTVRFDTILVGLPYSPPVLVKVEDEQKKNELFSKLRMIRMDCDAVGILGDPRWKSFSLPCELLNLIDAPRIQFAMDYILRNGDELDLWPLERFKELKIKYHRSSNIHAFARRVEHAIVTFPSKANLTDKIEHFLTEIINNPDGRSRLNHLWITQSGLTQNSLNIANSIVSLGFGLFWESLGAHTSYYRWVMYCLHMEKVSIVIALNENSLRVFFFDNMNRMALWNVVKGSMLTNKTETAAMIQDTFLSMLDYKEALSYALRFS